MDEKASLLLSNDTDRSTAIGEVGSSCVDRSRAINRVSGALVPPRHSKRWVSIYIMLFTMFTGSVTFSIVLSMLYPFLQEVTNNTSSTLVLGVVIAAYSLGQLVASPLLGFWSDKRPIVEPLVVSLVVTVLSNILYCYTQAFHHEYSLYVIIIARALVGFGGGNIAVARSYVSAATTESERVGAFAAISASQAIGFILGPVLGLAFVPLHESGLRQTEPYWYLNMYTGPGYLSAVLAGVNALLVLCLFKESRLVGGDNMKMPIINNSRNGKGRTSHSGSDNTVNVPTVPHSPSSTTLYKYDRLGTCVCVVLFFAVILMFAVFETIITPYSMDEFAWNRHEGVLYNNIMFGAMAVLSIVAYILVKYITKCVDERVVFMCGLFVAAFGFFVLIPMGNDTPIVHIGRTTHNITVLNDSMTGVESPSDDQKGCRYPQLQWCLTLPKLELYQYILGMFLLSFGYPISSVMCYSLFSRILGPNPQGTMMGVLTAAGCIARVVGPLLMTYLYDVAGPQVTSGTIVGVLILAILLLMVTCHRLVPLGTPRGCPSLITTTANS